MSSKIFIGDHSTVIIAFAHVTHVVSDPPELPPCICVYLCNAASPVVLSGVWVQTFISEYMSWADRS